MEIGPRVAPAPAPERPRGRKRGRGDKVDSEDLPHEEESENVLRDHAPVPTVRQPSTQFNAPPPPPPLDNLNERPQQELQGPVAGSGARITEGSSHPTGGRHPPSHPPPLLLATIPR
ncbi:hypothetical protein CAAN1_03S07558 [[Candida] anglica]|uniref:Uncharacterized protein n=1 Tax=[Candida] anglica TaxID=148631 RepID=A0ABP0ELQ5_9ASCO